jgi:hypothetical protein
VTDHQPPSQQFLDLYKLTVEMADRISARRGTANAFFLTLQTALVGLLGIAGSPSRPGGTVRVDPFAIVIASIVGLVLSATWWLLLRSYRDLNGAKFKVILAMEDQLGARPFGDEWRYLKEDPLKKRLLARYAELNVIERVVPAVFAVLYLAIGVRAVCS